MSERKFIPVARPDLGEEEAAAARRVILSGWVTQGPEVAAFEKEFARLVGAPQACAVSSCTTALHLALLAAGVGPGNEVITASHSFIATANSVRYCGAEPIFTDIQPGTFNLEPKLIEKAITAKTRAILCVHQLGMTCDLEAIIAIGRRHGLPVIEDAACAAGAEVRWNGQWEQIGKPHADAVCFSFHPRKVITTGDGGMITTARAEWDEKIRLWRQHGMSVSDAVRHGSAKVIFESYPVLGFNYRMTDLQAAVGREQLKRLPGLVARRRELAKMYDERLWKISGLGLPQEPAFARANWQSYCARLPERCDQQKVMQIMLDRGVATRRGVMCAHREASYSDRPPRFPLPESEKAQDHCLILPIFPRMTEDEVDYAAKTLQEACASA